MQSQALNLLSLGAILVYKNGMLLPVFARRADLSSCPQPLCAQPLAITEGTRDHPARWLCPNGHSGFLDPPDLSEPPKAFPPGEKHSSRHRHG